MKIIVIEKLFKIIRMGKIKKFTEKIKKHIHSKYFDINSKDENGNYFLNYAVNFNKIKLVEFLITNGSKIDIYDSMGRTILYIPLNYKFYEIIEFILNYSSKNIGIPITDLKDKYGKIPLHNAIELEDIISINLLLKYGSNITITENNENNSLHLAIKTKNKDLCKVILDNITNISDINIKTNNNETPLHIACNNNSYDIIKMLINKGCDIDCKNNNDYTPLLISILSKNIELVNLFIKNNSNINTQDVVGNTPLHISLTISEYINDCEILKILLNNKKKLNFNLWNINGQIPLHILLLKSKAIVLEFLETFIEYSDLNLQDRTGRSCFFLIIEKGYWKLFKKSLIKKKINIFIRNNKNKTIYDFINKDDLEDFINMIISNFIYNIKYKNYIIDEKINELCIKNDIKICKNEIKNKLINDIKIFIENKNNTYPSYPIKKDSIIINIENNNYADTKIYFYTGIVIDVLVGLIYLLEKHKNSCSVLTNNFYKKSDITNFYSTYGIYLDNSHEFLNFEVIWTCNKLFLPQDFNKLLIKCKNTKKFIIIPIAIEVKIDTQEGHAGYVIIDIDKKIIERFEPLGTNSTGMNIDTSILDNTLHNILKKIFPDFEYIYPSLYIPKIGFQSLDSKDEKKIGDPSGFCALWSTWYVDMRLTYSNISIHKIIEMLIKSVRKKTISFKQLIRNYGYNIVKIRDEILESAGIDINKWMNCNISKSENIKVIEILKERINKL